MLSNEEKAVLKTAKENYGLTSAEQKILVNLIEKQSKEIERTNEILIWKQRHEEQLQKEIEKLKENNGYHLGFIDGGIAKRYEYEDKIKAIIEEVQNMKAKAKDIVFKSSLNYIETELELKSLLKKE